MLNFFSDIKELFRPKTKILTNVNVHDAVNIGGCFGTISKIEDDKVYVTGTWFDFGNSYAEPWTATFSKKDMLEKCKILYDQIDASVIEALEWGVLN